MVFNFKPLADARKETVAAVINKAGDKGAAISFNTQQLPVLTLWKNYRHPETGLCDGD